MKSKKKIAFLLKMFPRFAETFILNEILELERQGAPLLLISLKRPNESFRQEKVQQVKSKVVYVPEPIRVTLLLLLRNLRPMIAVVKANVQLYKSHPERYKKALQIFWRLKDRKAKKRFLVAGYIGKMLLDAGIEHLHAHFANDPASVARFVHVLTGISYSFTAHAKDIYLSNQEALRAKIHEAKFVITCTNYNRTYLQGLSVNGAPIHTIYHGLDESIFGNGDGATQQSCCTSAPNTGAPPLILSVGRLVEKKGFDCLIAACHLLHYWGIPFRCQIIGEGPLGDSLRSDIGKFQIEKQVEILKFKPQQHLVEKYHEAALFALPCQISENGDRDGIPNVLVEAMASGLPVVATRVSGISEVIDPLENGFLVPPKNPWALAEALKEVLLKPEDYRYLGINGKKTVRQNFCLTSNVALLKKLLEIN